uniref:RING-type domain-containing protein n=1 Tax=Chenopodium quinoa TaxID=63459 RepID=A0A803L2N7_CHEQI
MDQTQAQEQAQSTHEQQPNKGLNQETIDSYPTIVVGDMLHLDDNTCPICLCEYDPSDVLKVLPECVHRFHCDCLVEWLKLNDTCPVCRTHPPRLSSSAIDT